VVDATLTTFTQGHEILYVENKEYTTFVKECNFVNVIFCRM